MDSCYWTQCSTKFFASCEQNFSCSTFLLETRMIFTSIFPYTTVEYDYNRRSCNPDNTNLMATKFILVTIWTIQGWLTGSVGLQLPSHIKTHEELISQHSNLVHRIRKKNSHNFKKKISSIGQILQVLWLFQVFPKNMQ